MFGRTLGRCTLGDIERRSRPDLCRFRGPRRFSCDTTFLCAPTGSSTARSSATLDARRIPARMGAPAVAAPVAATWTTDELESLKCEPAEDVNVAAYLPEATRFNPTPGTGKTGISDVPPNSYPFYSEDEKYVPNMQSDGGHVSEWKPMYQATPEQEEKDRQAAFASGIPHGYVAAHDKHDGPKICLLLRSDLHSDDEYGESVDEAGNHSGGPFWIEVSPKMRIEELRLVIRDKGGIPPALLRLSYAGKRMADSQRTLEHYGVKYWNAKFPHWPLVVLRQ
ncbi:unnamed protein product [Pedinophyceae sp. YPF-701]|nr:unnamed protein product [Pedinophyceae sp. YPF-701]